MTDMQFEELMREGMIYAEAIPLRPVFETPVKVVPCSCNSGNGTTHYALITSAGKTIADRISPEEWADHIALCINQASDEVNNQYAGPDKMPPFGWSEGDGDEYVIFRGTKKGSLREYHD